MSSFRIEGGGHMGFCNAHMPRGMVRALWGSYFGYQALAPLWWIAGHRVALAAWLTRTRTTW